MITKRIKIFLFLFNVDQFQSKSKNVGILTTLSSSFSCISTCKDRRWLSEDFRAPVSLSSRLDPTSSLMKRNVNIAETIDMDAHRSMTSALPNHDANGRKIVAPSNAPTFPLAAQTPLRDDLQGREKVMLGNMNVWKVQSVEEYCKVVRKKSTPNRI